MASPHWGPVDRKPRATRATSRPKAKGQAGTKGTRRGRVIKTIFKVLASLVLLGLVATTALVVVGYKTAELPNANEDFTTQTSFVYFNDGKTELGNFAVQNRQPLSYKEMPDSIKQAIVAAENQTFWTDKGISPRGMVRSAYVIARGGELQGGSTITQQYIKIMFLDQTDRTVKRKFRELFLAYKLNEQVPKEKILEDYLNTIYFGHGAYGIQAAAQAFFNVDAKDLTVRQSAVLASVINNPSAFDPADKDNRPRLLDRYQYVLRSMTEGGNADGTPAITAADAAKWSPKLPRFPKIKLNERYGGPNGFLLKMVEKELADNGFSSQDINGGGLKITTTFDKDAQDQAVESAEKITDQAAGSAAPVNGKKPKASRLHAAIASVDVDSGDVVALYGGPDYIESSRNWATTARPAASTFKAYTLAAGLKDGYTLRSRFHGNSFYLPDDPQRKNVVRNENSIQYGFNVDLIKATQDSINTAFVDLTTKMEGGGKKTLKVAQAAGLPETTGWDAAPRNIPIGTPEVSPLDQASGYAAFANGGTAVQHHVVKEVEDKAGKTVYKAKPDEKRAVSEDIANDVTYALSKVVSSGTGRSLSDFNRPENCYGGDNCRTVAGKTGTNGDDSGVNGKITSAWFVGYTKQISTAAMFVVGNDGQRDLDPYKRPGDSTFFGGTYPAMLWKDYMGAAMKGKDPKTFDPPAYVNSDQPKSTYSSKPSQRSDDDDDSDSNKSTTKPKPSSKPTKDPEPTTEPEPTKEPDPDPTKTSEPDDGDEGADEDGKPAANGTGNRRSGSGGAESDDPAAASGG